MRASSAATPAALIVLALAGAGYAYFVDSRTVSDADRASRRHDVFPTFRVDRVTRVAITTAAGALVLERDVDAGAARPVWEMTSPRRERADGGAVDRLLRELELATRVRDVKDGDGAGLDAPRAKGTVTVGTIAYQFELGADAPVPEGSAYMRLEGEGTFVVTRAVAAQLLKSPDDYRERALVPYGIADVARVEVRGGAAAGFALERAGATFRVAGDGLRAARPAVERVFAALANARAETFLADDEAERALGGAPLVVTVTPRDKEAPAVELRLGGRCPRWSEGVVAIRAKPDRRASCVATSTADALTSTPGALLDTSLFVAHADEMAEVRLEPVTGGPVIDLARRGSGWHERSPDDRELSGGDADPANALAAALADARGTDLRAGGAFAAASRVRIVRAGGLSTETVEVSTQGSDGSARVRRVDDGAVMQVPLAVARRLAPRPVAVRGRAVWKPSFDAAAITAFDSSCGAAPEKLALDGSAWRLASPAGFAPDGATVVEVLQAFASASADAWIADADDGTFGFGPGGCSLGAQLAGEAGARRVSLELGDAVGEGFYGRVSGDPAVFVVTGVLRALASRPALDRRPLELDLASLASLILTRGGERRVLDASSDGGDGDGDLLAAIAALHADAALHVGPPAAAEGFDTPTLELRARSLPDAGAAMERRITVGAATSLDGVDGYFARAAKVNASYFVRKTVVDPISKTP